MKKSTLSAGFQRRVDAAELAARGDFGGAYIQAMSDAEDWAGRRLAAGETIPEGYEKQPGAAGRAGWIRPTAALARLVTGR